MSKVNRSTYQKLAEENKRLLKDIKLLVDSQLTPEQIICISEWRKKFRKEKEFNVLMKEVGRQWMKDNPDNLIV
uniref:hypothetical protein n=1 Tax=Mariniflexile sp. TaxID=1979402 RepID=UPI0040478699